MNPTVKKFIEQHIVLLEQNNFDRFFDMAQEEFIPETVNEIANILETSEIFPIPYMTFIPEGYYMISRMTEFTTPENIFRISYKAFASSDIESLHVTGNCIQVLEEAFEGCSFMERAVFDEGVKIIEDSAFYACEDLKEVYLPQSLDILGHNVFNGCDNLTEIHYAGSMLQWEYVRNYQYVNEGGYVSKIICSDGTIDL